MKIVLLRHAARAMADFGDPPLSPTGRTQAENLARIVMGPGSKLPVPTLLYCSPKTRAKETLGPLSGVTRLPLHIDERLDERLSNENSRGFEQRVKTVLETLAGAPTSAREDACLYFCSHLDWLEIALRVLPTDLRDDIDPANWSNCEYRVFEAARGIWTSVANGSVSVEVPRF